MGIVAFCPSGHRVKVKDDLAGRKGVCPECQARFRIPLRSCTIPTARVLAIDAAAAASLPRAIILPADHAFLHADDGPENRPGRTPPERAAVQDPVPPAAALHPLLAEAPEAAWCIAVPGGTASTPLTASEMQAWLESDRATGTELVWRSDWADWVSIRLVFPEHLPV